MRMTIISHSKLIIAILIFLCISCTTNQIDLDIVDPNDSTLANEKMAYVSVLPKLNYEFSRSTTPMDKGIYFNLYTYFADSLIGKTTYITIAPGEVGDDYNLKIKPGIYNFYGFSANATSSSNLSDFDNGMSYYLHNNTDYLWSKLTGIEVPLGNSKYSLIFQHCCCQIIINIIPKDVVLNSINQALIYSSDNSECVINLFTGAVTPAQSLQNYTDQFTITDTKCSFIMMPLVYDKDIPLQFNITMNNSSQSTALNIGLPVPNGKFESGKSYEYSLILDSKRLRFANVNVVDWHIVDNSDNVIYPE